VEDLIRRVKGSGMNVRFIIDNERKHQRQDLLIPKCGKPEKIVMQQQIIYHNITVLIHVKHSIMNSLA